MEGGTEDSRLKRQRNRLDKLKSLKKNEKGVQKKKLLDTRGESNIHLIKKYSLLGMGSYNPSLNIKKLIQIPIPTCATTLDIYYNKHDTRVASRVSERLKTRPTGN